MMKLQFAFLTLFISRIMNSLSAIILTFHTSMLINNIANNCGKEYTTTIVLRIDFYYIKHKGNN